MITSRPPALLRIALLAGATALSASVFAQRLPDADVDFLKQAAQNGHAEVESGRVAQKQAQQDAVKTFASRMVDDHTKMGQQLATLAKRKGVEVPTEPSLLQRGQMKLLGTKDGTGFDRAYIEQMGITAHRDTIELFAKGMRESQDAEVKAFATQALPKLKDHLAMAERLQDSIGAKPQ